MTALAELPKAGVGVAGVPAHSEDLWIGQHVHVGEAVLVPRGNVGRCAVTTVNPESGKSDFDTLAAIGAYRGEKVSTNMNFVAPGCKHVSAEFAGQFVAGSPRYLQVCHKQCGDSIAAVAGG